MDMGKIRLIATDIDGTLIEEGKTNLNPEYFDVIRKLSEKGVACAVATGRHSVSVRETFTPVLDCVWIISQNGAVIEHNGEQIVAKPLPREWLLEFWKDLSEIEGADGILDTAERTYCPFDGTRMHHIVADEYKYNIYPTGGWDKIPDEIYSMTTIYHPDGADRMCQERGLYKKWLGKINMFTTGKTWVDCTMPGVNKGAGLRTMCETLGIRKEETIAFGDNSNDIPLLQASGWGCAVDTAKQDVKEAADQIIPGYAVHGVLQIMKDILREQA